MDGAMPRESRRVKTVAKILECDEGEIRRLIDQGEIEAHHIGRRGIRVYLDSVAAYQAGHPRLPKTKRDRERVAQKTKARQVDNRAHLEAMAELRRCGLIR